MVKLSKNHLTVANFAKILANVASRLVKHADSVAKVLCHLLLTLIIQLHSQSEIIHNTCQVSILQKH